jgi:hypothetical protein
MVARAFGIPYLIAEASHAPKRASGPWDIGFQGASDAIAGASMLLGLNSADTPCVRLLLDDPHRLLPLAPFIDPSPHLTAAACRWDHRYRIAGLYGLDPAVPWLVSVAMMRPGAKLASYRVLSETLAQVQDLPWSLLVIGDGTARAEVHAALAPVAARVHWLGQIGPSDLPAHLAAADIKVWPAIDEAFGMAILEAQAAGVPVVAGGGLGVGDLVCHGVTGLLAPSTPSVPKPIAFKRTRGSALSLRHLDSVDGQGAQKPVKNASVLTEAALAAALAQNLRRLLTDPRARAAMGAQAIEKVTRRHSLAAAAMTLDRALIAARERHAAVASTTSLAVIS